MLDQMSEKDVCDSEINTSIGLPHHPTAEKTWTVMVLCGLSEGKFNHKERCLPLPRMDDMLTKLDGTKWFSTLDMICGYWQVEVAPKDREKTVF